MILRLAFASVAAAVLLAGPVAAEEGGAAGVAAAAAPAVDQGERITYLHNKPCEQAMH